ncbi:MAG: hypothetical protein ACKOPT_12080 [Cyanobium sp.]
MLPSVVANELEQVAADAIRRPPLEILAELRAIEQKILQGIKELEGMLR